MRGARAARAVAVLVLAASGFAGCASDAAFPPPQPPAAAQHFKATTPGQFPIDVYFAAWGEGYVIYAPAEAPIYLISDKQGGFIVQRPGDARRNSFESGFRKERFRL